MEKKIATYISESKVFTLATCINNVPYCANCFYVFDEENKILIFLSSNSTRHVTEALANKKVAGTIQEQYVLV